MMDRSNLLGVEEGGGRCSTAKAFLDACFQERGVGDSGLWRNLNDLMKNIDGMDEPKGGKGCAIDGVGRVIVRALDAVRQLVCGDGDKRQYTEMEGLSDRDCIVELNEDLKMNDVRACRGVLRVVSDWINEHRVEVDLNFGVEVIESCRGFACVRNAVDNGVGSMQDRAGHHCDDELEACVVEGSMGIVGNVLRQVHGASLVGKGGKELEKAVHRFIVEGVMDVVPKSMPILLACAADALCQQAPQRILVEACRKCVERCVYVEEWEIVEKVVKQVLMCAGALSSPSVLIKDILTLFERIDKQLYLVEDETMTDERIKANSKFVEACVVHVGLAARRNAKIASSWMAMMKSPAWHGNPLFSVAVAFSLASMPRFRDQIWDIVKEAIIPIHNSEAEASLGLGVRLPDVLKPENRQRHVVESMIACARRFPSISMALVDFSIHSLNLQRVSNEVWITSQLEGLVVKVFEHSCNARQCIVSECLQACIIKGSSVDSFVKIIAELSKNHTGILVKECSGQLKNGISMLHTMGADCASGVVSALWPALQYDGELENMVIPNMRKLVRSTMAAHRLVGLKVILLYAKLKVQSTLSPENDSSDNEFGASQAYPTMSQIEMETGSHIPMFQELLGLLRRCLCQDSAMRNAVYQGVCELVQVDPQSRCSFAGLLLPKLQWAHESLRRSGLDNFVTSEDGILFKVTEPLGQLLFTAEIVSRVEENQKSMILKNIEDILQKICRLLYEKFSQADKDTQYFCANSHGQEKYMKIGLVQQLVAWATLRLSSKLNQINNYSQEAQSMMKESILLFVSVHNEMQTSNLGQNLEDVYPVGQVDKSLLKMILHCIAKGSHDFPMEIMSSPQYMAFAFDMILGWISCHPDSLEKDLGQSLLLAALSVLESKSSNNSLDLCTTTCSCHTRAACRALASCLPHMHSEVSVKNEWKRLEGLITKVIEEKQISAAFNILDSLKNAISEFECPNILDLVTREATRIWNLVLEKEIKGFCTDTLLHLRLRLGCKGGLNRDLDALKDIKNRIAGSYASQGSANAGPPFLYSNYGDVVLETGIQHIESCLDRIAYWGSKAAEIYKELSEEELSFVVSFEKEVFRRMEELAQVLAGIGALASQTSLKLAQSSIHGFAVLYKTLAISAKTMMRRNEFTLNQTLEFVNKIHEITPDVYSIIGEVQCLGENDDINHRPSRIQFKELPTLIFHMEEWEKRVVHLSRKLNVNLMANAKRTVNRDFKVKFGRKDFENLA